MAYRRINDARTKTQQRFQLASELLVTKVSVGQFLPLGTSSVLLFCNLYSITVRAERALRLWACILEAVVSNRGRVIVRPL